ncbi:glycosyltransferase [Microbacterium sp. MYb66]|uniref:glycosyltransferase n=1 Tax=Microbacterium sp. MYb66 TaxID=1848692 RepID=UPI000D0060D1|nr:glycosyltransferase [Microbacterium sp. MYb66]PRA82973.1 glycosyl transferase family 2 [Microbacterium sp. MYb66]
MSALAPLVDVTIAVHSATRPVRRAVASVLDGTTAPVRVIVVAHNIDPAVIRDNLGDLAGDDRVILLELQDGIRSPAGPMNAGFANSTAPFIALLGSDDEFAPGALDSWLRVQKETGASAVIPKIAIVGRHNNPLPPLRGGRRSRRLDAAKDRLAYRSAPLGLIDRNRFGHLRFAEGLSSGEDIALTAELWFRGRDLAVDIDGPAYVGHEDEKDRVTFTPRPVHEDFAFLAGLEDAAWFRGLRSRARTAVVVKLLRIQFLSAIGVRATSTEDLVTHQAELRETLGRLEKLAPRALRLLSRVDHRIIAEAFSSAPDVERIKVLANDRWNQRSFGALLTPNPWLSLHRQGMARLFFAANRTDRIT